VIACPSSPLPSQAFIVGFGLRPQAQKGVFEQLVLSCDLLEGFFVLGKHLALETSLYIGVLAIKLGIHPDLQVILVEAHFGIQSYKVRRGAVAIRIDGNTKVRVNLASYLTVEGVRLSLRQWLQKGALSLQPVNGSFSQRSVYPHVGGVGSPEIAFGIDILHVGKLAARKEVVFDIVKGSFHYAMTLLGSRRKDNDLEAIRVGKGFEHGIDPNLPGSGVPTHRGHIVVGNGLGNRAQFHESLLVEADHVPQSLIGKMAKEEPATETKNDRSRVDNLLSSTQNNVCFRQACVGVIYFDGGSLFLVVLTIAGPCTREMACHTKMDIEFWTGRDETKAAKSIFSLHLSGCGTAKWFCSQ
jgi:hypothetical protein